MLYIKKKIAALEEALSKQAEFKKFEEAYQMLSHLLKHYRMPWFGDVFIDMLPSKGALIGRLNSVARFYTMIQMKNGLLYAL